MSGVEQVRKSRRIAITWQETALGSTVKTSDIPEVRPNPDAMPGPRKHSLIAIISFGYGMKGPLKTTSPGAR